MAYELRRPIFDLSGSLAARVAAGDQQISCQGSKPGVANVFAALPVDYSNGLYLPLTVANDQTGKSEIMWGVGHASASPTLTVVRGRESTDIQTFDVGDVVRCSPTVRDVVSPYASRAALPSDPHIGMRALLLDEGVVVERSPFGWQDSAPLQGDPKRKRHYSQTNVTVPNGSALSTISGLTASGNDPGGSVGAMSAGVFTPGRMGFWTLSWSAFYNGVNNAGIYYQQMTWPSGAFPVGSTKGQIVHHTAGSGPRGNALVTVEWNGYVNATQAAAGITLQALQINDASAAIAGVNFDFAAEFLGA